MRDTEDSYARHALVAAAWLLLMLPRAAAAQQTAMPAPSSPGFMTRYDFHLMANSITSNDPRFAWDTHFGGDLDLVDYVSGRSIVTIDYEAVLGSEFRTFDPNQGNYTLEAASSVRAGDTEIVGMFHHVSRHLSD